MQKKEYYERNRDKIKERDRERYWKNRCSILEALAETFCCQCGSVCRKADKARHERTKKHQTYVNQIVQSPDALY